MRCLSILVLFWSLGPAALHAQIAGSNISGVVSDPSGALIPRAKIVLRNLATQIVRTLNTNLEGFYGAPNLPPGEYKAVVSAEGFKPQVARLTMAI